MNFSSLEPGGREQAESGKATLDSSLYECRTALSISSDRTEGKMGVFT